MHGPAGALLSLGLLRLIDWEGMEQCVLSEYSTGDAQLDALSKCILNLGRTPCPDPSHAHCQYRAGAMRVNEPVCNWRHQCPWTSKLKLD